MENKKQIRLFTYAIFGIALLVFGFYSSTMHYAYAIPSIVNIAYGTGTLGTNGIVAFDTSLLTTKHAWVAGTEVGSGRVTVWEKSSTLDTIIGVTSFGSAHTTANAIVYEPDSKHVIVTTNAGYGIIRASDGILLRNVTDATVTNIVELKNHNTANIIYGGFANGYKKMTYDSGSLTLTVTATINFGVNCDASCTDIAIDEQENYLFANDNGGAPTDGAIRYNLATDTFMNSVTWANSGVFSVEVDSDTNFVFLSGSAVSQVRKYVYDFSSATTLTVTSTPRFMAVDSPNNILYVFADSDDTIRLFDTTNNVQTDSLATSCTQIYRLEAKRHSTESMAIMACNGANAKFIHNDRVNVVPTQVCIDVNPLDDFVEITCIDDLDGDGIPDLETPTGQRVLQNTTTLFHQIACQAGIADCSNPNSKTNGLGLMLMLLLLLMAIGVIMFVTFRNDHSLSEIHPVIWFLVVIGVTGVSWQLGWTDAIPFFGSIVAICALGAFKVREWFG